MVWIIMSGYVWMIFMIHCIDDLYIADDSQSSKLFLDKILDRDHLEHPETVGTILSLRIAIARSPPYPPSPLASPPLNLHNPNP